VTRPKLAQLELWGERQSEDEARAYRHPHSGKQYPSVTTVLKMVDKSGLVQWAVNLAVEWCVNNVDRLLSMSVERGVGVAKYRWKDYRDERASVGDGVHATVEARHKKSWDFPELNDEQKAMIQQWEQFCTEHTVEIIYSEITVANEAAGYMGTFDLYARIDGVLYLIDLKTSRGTWPEHHYQLAALWAAPKWLIETDDMVWEEIDPFPVEKVAIIHLRDDLNELIEIENLSINYQIFQGYLQAWNGVDKIKQLEKKKEVAKRGFA